LWELNLEDKRVKPTVKTAQASNLGESGLVITDGIGWVAMKSSMCRNDACQMSLQRIWKSNITKPTMTRCQSVQNGRMGIPIKKTVTVLRLNRQ